jgi:peptidoglycan hydrolase-like protein with peptidoglycan-binding domain
MLTLKLTPLPPTILGIYGPQADQLPTRMRFLHPDAAASFMRIERGPRRLRVSDMWRSAESSAQARNQKRGVQPPGRSGHNFGFAMDLDVDWMLSQYQLSKPQLDSFMNENGWYCHRKDHLRDSESWHFNFFGGESDRYLTISGPFGSTSAGLEAKIQDVYGKSFLLGSRELQTALRTLRLYGGDIDGEIGPLSVEAIKAFQRTWELPVTGTAGPDTQRLLAFVTCERQIVPLPGEPPVG